MFYGFIVTFTMIQFIMKGQAQDEEYPGIHPFIRMFIQIFRQSIGDLQVINYSNWADDPSASDGLTFSTFARGFITYIVWGFWVLNIVIIQIIMLNLLIA